MKNILVIGAAGQIGSELVTELRKQYGINNVVAADINLSANAEVLKAGIFEEIDILDMVKLYEVMKKYQIDTVFNLVALLSAKGEDEPFLSWKVNVGGLVNLLYVCVEFKAALFTPSSIGAFGPGTPRDNTPQDTIQRPNTIYGVTKVSGELLCDYYHKKFGLDTRGLRYPGLISSLTPPGGGTTDYAVHIFYEAIEKGHYTCFLKSDTQMDMMYMPDAIDAAIQLMEADPAKLKHRNAFNVTSMQFDPEKLCLEIKKHIPNFTIDYNIDPVRQAIADSWPRSLDDSCAREEWGWNPKYNISSMTEDMLKVLRKSK
ncbi:MAG: NAD-dependent epimerase/dehydratase family protein [Candidatus Cloacimonetes bacterium]|nr:NAD-dependent epimerase/dehydratase family protein [Candidatus Cloacimonadota bacterium]